jgi:hypothetical protein
MTVVVTPAAITAGGAIETRGNWTQGFAGDEATADGWPALAAFGGSAADLVGSGAWLRHQLTKPDLNALGIGSARVNEAVQGDTAVRFTNAAFPNPGSQQLHVRLIGLDQRTIGTATYFELAEAAQRVTIRRDGTALEFEAELGTYTETLDIEAFTLGWLFIDAILDFTDGFTVYVNGIDATPAFTGPAGPLAAFGADAALNLLNNNAATDPAEDFKLLFAGVRVGGAVTLEEHQADAELCNLREDGLAIDDFIDWTWAWSPNRLETEDDVITLPGMPDAGAATATLNLSSGAQLSYDLATEEVRQEGLGRPRLNHGISLDTASGTFTSAAGFEEIDGDFHLRAVFKLRSGSDDVQPILAIADPSAPTLRATISVDAAAAAPGDLELQATTPYALSFAGAVANDRWHLLDFVVDRDGGPGGVALAFVFLDGLDLSAAAHSSTIADIPEGAVVHLLSDPDGGNAAINTRLAFAGISDQIVTLAEHKLDALALGLM